GYVDPEFPELAMDSGRAPQRIRGGHFADERDDLGVDGRAAPGGPPGELGPVRAKATPLPTEHGVGGHDDESPPPACPPAGHPDPEPSITPAELRPRRCPLVHGKLLTQRQVLEGEGAVAAAEERKESNEVKQGGDHRSEILPGAELPDQSLGRRMAFWRRTPLTASPAAARNSRRSPA